MLRINEVLVVSVITVPYRNDRYRDRRDYINVTHESISIHNTLSNVVYGRLRSRQTNRLDVFDRASLLFYCRRSRTGLARL
jgi:hypothetical protein